MSPRFATVSRVDALARFVLRHRLLVALSWLALLIGGGIAAGPAAGRLNFDFSLPGQPGYETEQQMIDTFGTSSADTLVPVLTVPAGETVQQHAAEIKTIFQTVRTSLPQARVVDLASTGDSRFVTNDGRSTFALVQGPLPEGFGPGIGSRDAERVWRGIRRGRLCSRDRHPEAHRQ